MRKDQTPKLQLVEVEWNDAACAHGWKARSEAIAESGTTAIVTAGYLLSADKTCVRVVLNKHDITRSDGYIEQMSEIMAIPAGWIRRIKRYPSWR